MLRMILFQINQKSRHALHQKATIVSEKNNLEVANSVMGWLILASSQMPSELYCTSSAGRGNQE